MKHHRLTSVLREQLEAFRAQVFKERAILFRTFSWLQSGDIKVVILFHDEAASI